MCATFAKTITEADIVLFAAVSGDNNAIHINEEFAAGTIFKGRIAHGLLSASVISAAIANKLPGPGSIYVSQSLRFRAPVRADDTVRAIVTVKEMIPVRFRVLLATVCTVGGLVVIEGEALVALPAPSPPEYLSPRPENEVIADVLLDNAVAIMAADHGIGQVHVFDFGLQLAPIVLGDFAAKNDGDLVWLSDGSIGVKQTFAEIVQRRNHRV
jgi:3-hydroxybutyryl-CoA dehydratase